MNVHVFLLGEYLGVEFLEHMVGVYLTLTFLFFIAFFL